MQPELQNQVENKAAWAQKQLDAARNRLLQAERAKEFWDKLAADIRAGNSASILLLMRRNAGYIRELRDSKDPAADDLEKIQMAVDEQARTAVGSMGRAFPEAVRAAGLQIDASSRHPTYTFKQGFIHVDLDERNLTAKLTPRDGDETMMGLDLHPIVEKLRAEIARLFERPLQSESLLRSIYTAYLATLRAEGRPEGEELPLRRVVNRMAKNLNRFAADEFNIDLAQLVKLNHLTIDGRRMHLNHTRNARQGMLLQGLESGGYVGFVSFRQEGQP